MGYKDTVTITIDPEVKKKAMDIIQNKMNSSMSAEIQKLFIKIIKQKEEKIIDSNS